MALKKKRPGVACIRPKLEAQLSCTVVFCEINMGIRGLCCKNDTNHTSTLWKCVEILNVKKELAYMITQL